jgi:hypothetical protein
MEVGLRPSLLHAFGCCTVLQAITTHNAASSLGHTTRQNIYNIKNNTNQILVLR